MAQQFTAGDAERIGHSPQSGRLINAQIMDRFSRPFHGLIAFGVSFPAINRWAIFKSSAKRTNSIATWHSWALPTAIKLNRCAVPAEPVAVRIFEVHAF